MSIYPESLVLGDPTTSAQESFTVIKLLGEGSFAAVFLCNWHGVPGPPEPPYGVRINPGAEPSGMHLVAVKKMKRKWEHDRHECKNLKAVKALRALSPHPCIVHLYDVFLTSETSELSFVFEAMEGNLYQLMKCRKGRPFTTGLMAHIFQQMAAGLHHIHSSGYFHRDIKPENILVTTTGLFNYPSLLSQSKQDDVGQRDITIICKITDFDSAREISSAPPYTECVSGRWYRAPEVLFFQRDYSTPVDMWALGTVMAELVNLRPIFPGSGEIDQIHRIINVLGDPADYGVDESGRPRGGGPWPRGLELASGRAFVFPKAEPRNIYAMFDGQTPRRLIECISDLLKFDPNLRITSQQCLAESRMIISGNVCQRTSLICFLDKNFTRNNHRILTRSTQCLGF